jgi:hypothetical protein
MHANISDKALRILRSARTEALTNDNRAPSNAIERKRREVLERTNADVVAQPTWRFWSAEARYRKLAKNKALEARLGVFQDDVQSVRAANRVMNNAALVGVMTAAEQFIVQLRAICDVGKQAVLEGAQIDLLSSLRLHLSEVEALRDQGGIPDAILDQRIEDALEQYAARSIKIAALDFEFDKKPLLKVNGEMMSTQDGAQ